MGKSNLHSFLAKAPPYSGGQAARKYLSDQDYIEQDEGAVVDPIFRKWLPLVL